MDESKSELESKSDCNIQSGCRESGSERQSDHYERETRKHFHLRKVCNTASPFASFGQIQMKAANIFTSLLAL
jgi:hypothetical protein